MISFQHITLVITLLCYLNGFSQTERVTGNFNNIKFPAFVMSVEQQTTAHFYYKDAALDTFSINLSAINQPLDQLLENIFKGSSFQFFIAADKRIFITNAINLKAKLPDNFFNALPRVNAGYIDTSYLDDQSTDKSKLRNAIENRLFEIGPRQSDLSGKASIAGYIKDVKTGEPLVGASVFIDSPYTGVYTDQYGYYSLLLKKGYHTLKVSSIGMKDTRRLVMLYADGRLNIEMQDYVPALKAVIVQSEKKSNVRGLQMGVERLNIKTIKQVPVVFGEADILRVVLTLPGVSSVGEASTGFNVRGGAVDQNLILFNDATIYNPSHLFGFFSAFNPDIVKTVELYKSTIPEKYGGRLSSVLDVTGKNGNSKKITGTGGIGLLTSKLTLEGPIIKDKTSFVAGVRTTYSDWLLNSIPGSEYKNSSAGFADGNLLVNHAINSKNTLYLTAYISNDRFRLRNDTTYKYGNKNVNLKWKHIFNNKFNNTVTVGLDRYQYAINSEGNKVNAFELGFDINQYYLRSDVNYTPNNRHSINFGISSIYYKLNPGSYQPVGKESLVKPNRLESETGIESALYIGDQYTINDNLSVNAGIRFSLFSFLGPKNEYQYVPGFPRSENSVQDSIVYGSGKVVKSYSGPEIRLALRYALSESSSLKLSFNTMRQYIHTLSNTISISPTDIWKLSDTYIKPQLGKQFSLGYYRNFSSNSIETSAELYYKLINNYLDYKSGAILLMNTSIERDIINTRGRAYGFELMIKKVSGKLNGWLSYTYSRTELKMDDPIAGELINEGNFYPSNFDKPHTVNFISNYRFSHRYAVSFNTIYSTGRPITLPLALFNYGGSQRVYYSQRNQYRVPDYFRMDLSVNIEGNHKIKKLAHSSWSVGVYNLTFRDNPYSVYFVKEGNMIKGYQLSIFGSAIPFVTYNFRF